MRYLKDKKRIKGQCTYCAGPVTPPKRYWCSANCVHEWKIRRSSRYLREQVFKRDKGICGKCGKDCHTPWLQLKKLRTQFLATHFNGSPSTYLLNRYWELAVECGLKLPPNPAQHIIRNRPRSLWDADHILAVEEGGGACGLENIWTLCLRCHKEKTKKHAKRRAKRNATNRNKRHSRSTRKNHNTKD